MTTTPKPQSLMEAASETYIENDCYAMDGNGPHRDSFKAGYRAALRAPEIVALMQAVDSWKIQVETYGGDYLPEHYKLLVHRLDGVVTLIKECSHD